MTPPVETPESLVRNVTQGMLLVLEVPHQHPGLEVVASRATLEYWLERLLLALDLAGQPPAP